MNETLIELLFNILMEILKYPIRTRVMAHVSNGSMFRTPRKFPSIIYSILNILNKLLKEFAGCPKHGPVRNMGHYPNYINLSQIFIRNTSTFVNKNNEFKSCEKRPKTTLAAPGRLV